MHPTPNSSRIHTFLSLAFGLLALAIGFNGCVVWNFVDTRYQNVTGFFNTYYNAQTLFNEAEDDIRRERRLVDNSPAAAIQNPAALKQRSADGSVAPSLPNPEPPVPGQSGGVPSSAIEKLERVIAKCSRILVDYKKSKWIDNALLLIGKAHYYKQEYTRAERKFKELLDSFPESSLAAEAQLWLGKNYSAIAYYDDAEKAFTRAIEKGTEEDQASIVAEAYYASGEMWLARKSQKKAVESFQKGTSFAGNSDIRMQMLLALAREQEKIGDKKAAAKAYREILRLNPDKEVSFYSELSLARLSRETGEIDNAVNTLVDMLDTPAYLEYDGQIQLEIGRLYEAVSEYPSAVDQYRFVDTTFRNKPEAAEASFALGKMFEEKGRNYDKAFEHYSNARTAYPGIDASFRGGLKADDFAEYRRMRNRMFEMDTLLYFVLHPDSLARRDSLQVISDSVANIAGKKSGGGAMSEDERLREKFARRRPHGRNSGRVNPYEAQKQVASLVATPLGGGGAGAAKQGGAAGQPLYRRLDLRKLSPDSVLQNLSVLRMDFGWILFDRIKDLDSSFYYYRLAVDGKLPDSVKANAYYTLAEISRRMGDSSLAADYENRLIRELPNTRYALSVMRERGIEAPKDSLVVTREAYDRAARVLETGGPIAGLAALERMRDSYPHSEQAVRAKLAIGMTLETLPGKQEQALTVYRDMVKNHPASKYSKRAKDILESIEKAPLEEEARRKKAEEAKRLAAEQEAKKLQEIKQSFPTPVRDTTTRTTRLKRRTDPTLDDDFPLNLPGDKPKNPSKPDSLRRQGNPDPLEPPAPQPGAPAPQLPGKTRLNAEPEEKQEPLSTPRKGP